MTYKVNILQTSFCVWWILFLLCGALKKAFVIYFGSVMDAPVQCHFSYVFSFERAWRI